MSGSAEFHATPVLLEIRTDDFHIEYDHSNTVRDRSPLEPRQRPRVHAVGDNHTTEAQVVLGDRLRNGVSFRFDSMSRIAQRLFDRVDPEVDRAGRPGERAGDCGLSNAWKAGHHDEHGAVYASRRQAGYGVP